MENYLHPCILVLFCLISTAGIEQKTEPACDGKDKYIQWPKDYSDVNNMVFYFNNQPFASLHVPSERFEHGVNTALGEERIKRLGKNMILIKNFTDEDIGVYLIQMTYTSPTKAIKEISVAPTSVEKPGELHLSTAPDYRCSASYLGSPPAVLQIKVNGELKHNSASTPRWENITTVQCCLTGLVVPCLDEADGQSEWCTPEYNVPIISTDNSESGSSNVSFSTIILIVVPLCVVVGLCLCLVWFRKPVVSCLRGRFKGSKEDISPSIENNSTGSEDENSTMDIMMALVTLQQSGKDLEISQDIQTRPYLRESSVRPVDEENAICSINNKVETSLSSVDEESLSLLNKKQEMTEAGGKGGSSSNKRF